MMLMSVGLSQVPLVNHDGTERFQKISYKPQHGTTGSLTLRVPDKIMCADGLVVLVGPIEDLVSQGEVELVPLGLSDFLYGRDAKEYISIHTMFRA